MEEVELISVLYYSVLQDPMKFAILCFDRCSQLPGKKLNTIRDGGKIWKEVTSAVMEPCVNTVLKHLIHGELLLIRMMFFTLTVL